MAISSVNITRVSFNLRTMSLLDTLRSNTLALFEEQNRLATGKQLLNISDDPVGTTRVVGLKQWLGERDKIGSALAFADRFLANTDANLNEVADLVLTARSLALENLNDTQSAEQRASAAQVVESLIDSLVVLGNRQYLDIHEFAGLRIDGAPFVREGDGVLYNGDSGALSVRAPDGSDLAFNLTGSDLFGAISTEVRGFVDLNPAVTTDTRISDLRGATGEGVILGDIQIDDVDAGISFTVSLSGSATLGDIVDRINDAAASAGSSITAALSAVGLVLDTVPTGGQIDVSDVDDGVTALHLGIRTGAPQAGPVTGGDLDPRLTPTTGVGDLDGGNGLTLTDPILITNGGRSATIDLTGAATIEDILNAINQAGLAVEATISDDGRSIDVRSRLSGAELSIGESGGTTATDLGIRSLHAGTLLSSLNHGRGVEIVEGEDDLRIVARDGTVFDINLDGATTVQDVLDRINAATGGQVVASLAVTGNGIRLVDNTGGSGVLEVMRPPDSPSFAAEDLGLVGTASPPGELVGQDVNTARPEGIFTALLRLRDALQANDTRGISEAAEMIEQAQEEITLVRGLVGSRSQGLARQVEENDEAVLDLRRQRSEIEDLDFTEAVTRFQQVQNALQANLATGARLLSLSLLDFLR